MLRCRGPSADPMRRAGRLLDGRVLTGRCVRGERGELVLGRCCRLEQPARWLTGPREGCLADRLSRGAALSPVDLAFPASDPHQLPAALRPMRAPLLADYFDLA